MLSLNTSLHCVWCRTAWYSFSGVPLSEEAKSSRSFWWVTLRIWPTRDSTNFCQSWVPNRERIRSWRRPRSRDTGARQLRKRNGQRTRCKAILATPLPLGRTHQHRGIWEHLIRIKGYALYPWRRTLCTNSRNTMQGSDGWSSERGHLPELNLRSYLHCRSDLDLQTIRKLIKGRSRDEAAELEQSLAEAMLKKMRRQINQHRNPNMKPP